MFWTGPWRFARLAMAALAMIAGLLATTPETAKAAPYAAFVMDARDREVIAWKGVARAGISGADIRDMMLEAVEKRFGGALQAAHPVAWLSAEDS